MASRRQFVVAGTVGALIAQVSSHVVGQTHKQTKIGILTTRPLAESFYTGLIMRQLADLGYREGAGLTLEYRAAEGLSERYPGMARDLVERKCNLIFAVGPEHAALALRDASSAIPIVFLAIDFDPLQTGVIKSLSRPGSNITGVYVPQNELAAKRLDILKEVLPAATRFLVLSDDFTRDQLVTLRRRSEAIRVQLTAVEFSRQPYDYAAAFEAARRDKAQALIGLASGVFATDAPKITALLAETRLPSAGTSAALAERGFMLSYGPDNSKITRRVAQMGVRILKGAKPADIPVEQADEFVLVVNGPIAKKLGVKIPESVMARATRIIT